MKIALPTAICAVLLTLSGCSDAGSAKGELTPGSEPTNVGDIAWDEAAEHVGDAARVCGPLAGSARDGDDTFLNIGEDYPDPERFVVVVWDTRRYDVPPKESRICVEGQITEYEGSTQIEVRDAESIDIKWKGLRNQPVSVACRFVFSKAGDLNVMKTTDPGDYREFARVLKFTWSTGNVDARAALVPIIQPLDRFLNDAKTQEEFGDAHDEFLAELADFARICETVAPK